MKLASGLLEVCDIYDLKYTADVRSAGDISRYKGYITRDGKDETVFDMTVTVNTADNAIEIHSIIVKDSCRRMGIFKNILKQIEACYDYVQFNIVCNRLMYIILDKYEYNVNVFHEIFNRVANNFAAGELAYKYAEPEFRPVDMYKDVVRWVG